MNLDTSYIVKYESFNARYLSIDQLSNTFVPTKHFFDLAKNNHTLLMGPRGCGKTTLLKMLTPLAIEKYNKNSGGKQKMYFPFIGVYIPADRQWETQIARFKRQMHHKPEFVEKILQEVVNLNILTSLIETFQQLIQLLPDEERTLLYEAELSKQLKRILEINEPIALDLFSVKQALKLRIKDVNVLIKKLHSGLIKEENIIYPEYFFRNYFDLVGLSADAFEFIFAGVKEFSNLEFKWALCFDELEIAPKFLQEDLINTSLRSRNQKILFKLTTLPLVALDDQSSFDSFITRPSNRNDYQVIRMWLHDKATEDDWNQFSKKLFSSIINTSLTSKKTPQQILGKFDIDNAILTSEPSKFGDRKKEMKINERGSITWTVFKELARYDKDFFAFLVKRRVDPLNPLAEDRRHESSGIRKVKVIAFLRYYFKRAGGDRTRNKNLFYFGEESVYKISDGNPRILINLLNDLIATYSPLENTPSKLSIASQAEIITKFSNEWLTSICSHPDLGNLVKVSSGNPLKTLIDIIGEYFRAEILGDKFIVNPRGSFVIDDQVNGELIKLLKFALDYGIIQYINPSRDVHNDPLRNETFRLTFTIYPTYDLPIREYETINLSTILSKSGYISEFVNRRNKKDLDNQQKLFDENQG